MDLFSNSVFCAVDLCGSDLIPVALPVLKAHSCYSCNSTLFSQQFGQQFSVSFCDELNTKQNTLPVWTHLNFTVKTYSGTPGMVLQQADAQGYSPVKRKDDDEGTLSRRPGVCCNSANVLVKAMGKAQSSSCWEVPHWAGLTSSPSSTMFSVWLTAEYTQPRLDYYRTIFLILKKSNYFPKGKSH